LVAPEPCDVLLDVEEPLELLSLAFCGGVALSILAAGGCFPPSPALLGAFSGGVALSIAAAGGCLPFF